MTKIEKELTIGKFITLIVANLSIVGVMGTMVWTTYADPLVRHSARDEIEQWKKDSLVIIVDRAIIARGGGFKRQTSHELSKRGHSVDPDDLPSAFADTYAWIDSLKLFDKIIKPMLIDELKYYDVGLKVQRFSMDVEYLHTDGRTYFPSYSSENKKWYILKNGTTFWCE